MKIAKVFIQNILGIKELSFNPGTITVISGKNGSGKSSALRSMTLPLEKGHDASVLRKGAKEGIVRFEMDTGAVLLVTVTANKTNREYTGPDGIVVPNTPTFLKTLGESMSVDPGVLMSIDATKAAGKKELMAALFAAMPVEFTDREVAAAINPAGVVAQQTVGNLDELAKLRKDIEETRRKIGVEAKSAEGTVRELARQLQPDGEEKDWPAEAITLESERNALELGLSEKANSLRTEATSEIQSMKNDLTVEIQAIQDAARMEIRQVEQKINGAIADRNAVLLAALHESSAQAAPDYDRLTAELATAREKAAAAERIAGAKATVETMRVKVREKNAEYDRFTRAIESLDALKQSKLDNLPVAGLNFNGDDVTVDGVEWQNVNRAKRAEIAIQLCSMQAGQLPFLVVDDLEHIDRESQRAIFDAATAAGFQVAGAVVISGQPLKVETEKHP